MILAFDPKTILHHLERPYKKHSCLKFKNLRYFARKISGLHEKRLKWVITRECVDVTKSISPINQPHSSVHMHYMDFSILKTLQKRFVKKLAKENFKS